MSALSNFYENKAIAITGAASGIGLALAHCFAGNGACLALSDIDAKGLDAAVKNLKAQFPSLQIFIFAFDVANPSQWEIFLASSYEALGNLDILINNAGIEGSARPVWATDDNVLQRVMDVNFFGMVYGTKAVLPYLIKRDWAALVNVSSIFGLIGPPNAADYAASKFAIRGYTEALHAELSQIHPQVQVHLVHPGGINTQITRLEHSQKFKSKFLKTPPAALAKVIAESVMRNHSRIVYGHQSRLVKITSRLLPLSWLSRILSKQMQPVNMTEDYQQDHLGFKSQSKKP